MSRHSVVCRNSGARHCVTIRLCARDIDTLSRQCGAALRRDREGHVRATNQAERAPRLGRTTEVFYRYRDFSVAIDFLQW